MNPTDLDPERNSRFKFARQISRESILIILASIAIIAAALSWARAERAIDDNKDLKAIVIGLQTSAGFQQEMYGETERDCRLAQAHVSDFRIALFKAGIEVEHTGETP